ncbi:phytanoyl-CoA dioxygenase family protein [Streptomyces sp. NPDC019443]|uniref:phytanoyl-CoA dioxygenase family protein n=1 Tax=Streptomyces sp. NPDC019443 TaxID=3365061 RepID=UPI00379D53E1
MNVLPTLTAREQATAESWLSLLRQYGIAVAPAWVAGSRLNGLLDEHERAFNEVTVGVREVDYRPGISSRALRLTAAKAHSFPGIRSFLYDSTLTAVAADYLGAGATVHKFAYLTQDVPDLTPVTALHYDRKHALKAYLCLTTARQDWGAPSFVPASHRRSRMIREAHLAVGTPQARLPITQGHETEVPIPLAGPAGTLVLFDTDCLHQGGVVEPGNVRRVVRGHSHPSAKDNN